MRNLKALFATLVPVLTAFVTAAIASETLEVVQSAPLETTLAVPGIRQTQEVWLELIQGAKVSLDIEQFYVSDQAGEGLEPVLEAIRAAAGRGVRVRLLADSKFYKTYPESINQLARVPHCEARLIDFAGLGGVQHAKYLIADGAESYIGSANFDWRALNQIHEIGLKVTDPKAGADLALLFAKDWEMADAVGKSGSIRSAGASDVTSSASEISVVASPAQANPAGILDSLSTLKSLMASAKQSIRIQVMEYSTFVYGSAKRWLELDNALRAAASRGVQVQLLVDVSNLKKSKAELKALAKVRNIEVRSVTIPAWSGGQIPYARLIHSKYLVADGSSAWVGSENWSAGYFLNTRDVGAVIHEQKAAGQLNQVFERVWQSSYAAPVN